MLNYELLLWFVNFIKEINVFVKIYRLGTLKRKDVLEGKAESR